MVVSPVLDRARRALLSLVAAGLCACTQGPSAPPKTRPPPLVSVARVEAKDVPVEVRAPVDLRPIAQADVGSKILGYIDAVLVDRGDHVKKGQVVALVRPSDLPDQLATARSALSQASANRTLAQLNADRSTQLRPDGIVPQSDVDRTRAALDAARAAEEAVRSQIAGLAVRLGEARIESPLDGVVLTRRLDPGALVGPPGGGAIITVARTDVLRVFIDVNERDAKGVVVGLDAHVELDALPGRSFTGKVVRLAPAFDPVTRTLQAEVDLDNAAGELRPGMYGQGSIRVDLHPARAVIPATAMQVSDKVRYVFVLQGDKVERRTIDTGVDAGDWLEVLKGLSAGEEVVTAGGDGLANGSAVRVARDGAPHAGASPSGASPGGSAAIPSASTAAQKPVP